MLEDLPPRNEQLTVVRLAAVKDEIVKRLLERGISPASFAEIRSRLRQLGAVFEPSQLLIDKVFEPSKDPAHQTPFQITRFTNGEKAVFYSALEDETSIEEIRYHQMESGEFSDLKNSSTAYPRYFSLFETDFGGSVLDLFEIHSDCPELTSADTSGYPKCQELAEEARSMEVNAFRTPSARRPTGICTPVFDRQSLGDTPQLKSHGKFVNEGGEVIFKKV